MSDGIEQAAVNAAAKIWEDLTDRRGVKHELQSCDAEVQAEIRQAHAKIIAKALRANILSLLPEAKWKRAVTDYQDGHKPDQRYSWEASNGGHYSVHFNGEEDRWTWSAVYVDYYDETGPIECPSLESGQAACRADFERRVAEIFGFTST